MNGVKEYVCQKCGVGFAKPRSLAAHTKVHKKHECRSCGENFGSHVKLERHKLTCRKENNSKELQENHQRLLGMGKMVSMFLQNHDYMFETGLSEKHKQALTIYRWECSRHFPMWYESLGKKRWWLSWRRQMTSGWYGFRGSKDMNARHSYGNTSNFILEVAKS